MVRLLGRFIVSFIYVGLSFIILTRILKLDTVTALAIVAFINIIIGYLEMSRGQLLPVLGRHYSSASKLVGIKTDRVDIESPTFKEAWLGYKDKEHGLSIKGKSILGDLLGSRSGSEHFLMAGLIIAYILVEYV